jgi:hypothetical protein
MANLGKIFAGSGLTLTRSALGNSLSWKPKRTWDHPWSTSARFNPQSNQWLGSVVPGFCNGVTPSVNLTVGTAPIGNPQAQIWALLTDGPAIPMQYRNIGVDDQSGNAIPAFFAKLGVNPGLAFDPNNPLQEPQNVPPNNRLLRACDFVLQQPRYALGSNITLGDAVTDGYTMIQSFNIVAPSAAQRLMVYTTSQWTPANPQLDLDDGTYEEPTYDEILIATLYLLSPPGAGWGSAPDASWTPYTQHNLFWNLNWAQSTTITQPAPADLSFIIALPSGILFQPIVNEILAEDNDALNQIEDEIDAHSLAGSFWSQGGCQPLVTATAQTQVYGLNKALRNAAEAAQARQQPAPLDPAFPYTGQSFPTSLLTTNP